MTLGLSLKWRIIIGSILLLALVGALSYFQGKFHVVSVVGFFEWLEGFGACAPLLFILAEMVVVGSITCFSPGIKRKSMEKLLIAVITGHNPNQ